MSFLVTGWQFDTEESQFEMEYNDNINIPNHNNNSHVNYQKNPIVVRSNTKINVNIHENNEEVENSKVMQLSMYRLLCYY